MLQCNHPLSVQERRLRWGALGLLGAPILGSLIYSQGHRIPFLICPIRFFTGIPCPTCGMTSSFTAIAQGNWEQAVSHHLFGPVLFLLFSLIIIHLAIELATQKKLEAFYVEFAKQKQIQIFSLIAYLTYYALRLFHWMSYGEMTIL